MIVVLLVLGLIGALGLARGPFHSPALDLRGAGQLLASALRETRLQAIGAGSTRMFTIGTGPAGVWYGGPPGPGTVLPTLPRKVALASGPARIVFFPDGSALGAPIVLAEGGRRVVLRVNWLSGAITLEGP
ncbi:pseudopilin H [Acetobacter sp. TBRC 12305]|uniref:Pseudopilin H n=2 Tax=Acetobacter garciniae TaxID=2817435 RepID=A0A939HLT0_9PROT|nr:pseudopilin H [Acetobacter garciniae]MBX0344904.1 pseudopilin H [Acetobacter garciniae]